MTRLQITYFLAVAEHGGFTKAAQALFVSQPTLTQQIASLEREFGFKLFQRLHQSVQLTEEGRIMFQCFQQFETSFQQAYARAAQISAGATGTLSVGLLVMSDMRDIPRRISAYCNEKKGRFVRFLHGHLSDLGPMLMEGALDIAFLFDDLAVAFPTLKAAPVFDSEYKLVLPAGDPLAEKDSFTVSDLSGKTMLVSSHSYPAVQKTQEATFHQIGLDRLPQASVSGLEAVYTMVASGLGFALGSDHNNLLNGERFALLGTGVYHKMCVVWHPGRISSFAQNCLKEIFCVDASCFR